MHRLASLPNNSESLADNLIFVNQEPAPIVFITAADTDIQILSIVTSQLPSEFPSIRVVNILQLQQQVIIDTYGEEVLKFAQIIILRIIGGRSYWSYGLEVVKALSEENKIKLIVLPGDSILDLELMSHSTVSPEAVNYVWQYLLEGGITNYTNLLYYVATEFLDQTFLSQPPLSVPRIGFYYKDSELTKPTVAILFYRAHYLSGNTKTIDLLIESLQKRNISCKAIYVSSLKDEDIQIELLSLCNDCGVILNTTSFTLANLKELETKISLWEELNIPVLQVIFSGGGKKTWIESKKGLSPRDLAMNVVLPEVDGRIITRAVSFKGSSHFNNDLQTDVVIYEPDRAGIEFVVNLSQSWLKLQRKQNKEKKIALILANYPNQDGRIGNGVGLDTPASCLKILSKLQTEGYQIDKIPETSEELINLLTQTKTNDRENNQLRPIGQYLTESEYKKFFSSLPSLVQSEITDRWGYFNEDNIFNISGKQMGNIFVGIQPPRGYDLDPSFNYHNPDLVPPHNYLAFYVWLREIFKADAIIHVGKHGNLEWLPGKAVALSENCYPGLILGAIPHFYPFIVNDPGEGSQAKRRTQAIILAHLTPPMARAELYGNLQQLECLIDEYYEVEDLDPDRLNLVKNKIISLIKTENIHQDLGINLEQLEESIDRILATADGYLCDLKELQIRDGLHIFGCCPQGDQLRDLVIAVARNPTPNRSGLTRAIAQYWNLGFDPLTANLGEKLSTSSPYLVNCRTIGDAVNQIEEYAKQLVEDLISNQEIKIKSEPLYSELVWVRDFLLPNLARTDRELDNLIRGLNGKFIPSGASGAPTRGRPEVLPTGRNFYSVDIRAVPTETAWDIGRKAAENLVEYHTQIHGEYPKTVAISIWGTSTMRTGGDDFAQALALLGVRPIWDGVSRRVVDFEILPLTVLGRPRVDVTLRISGFFRDAFPNLIELFDRVVKVISNLEETPDQNPLVHQIEQETKLWEEQGLSNSEARNRASLRIFGSPPGAYGAGLQGLISSRNWSTAADLANAYFNWSAFAYGNNIEGESAPEAFQQRLEALQIVLQNQDNREHDLLDSDDYYQFQGGLANAIKNATGVMPAIYFGDNSCQQNPKIRKLTDEIALVYRARVVNPKWIKGMMRHGYKGAFELAATIDFLFAYDATTNCVSDFMYEGVANAYIFDEQVAGFIAKNNPWAGKEIAERLLEAHQRQLWENPPIGIIDRLKEMANLWEGMIEARANPQ